LRCGDAGQYQFAISVLSILMAMDQRQSEPQLLASFGVGRARAWACAILVVWTLLIAVDWVVRFRHFRWQDRWWPVAPVAESGGSTTVAELRTIFVPAATGGSLSRMVPVQHVAKRYEEQHPAYLRHLDSWGYYNEPAPEGGGYPIVFVGDSVLVDLGTQTLAQVVSEIGGLPAYNHGKAGAGPFLEMQRFIVQNRFDPLPRVVVWNLSARELGAPLFLRQPVDYWFQLRKGEGESASAIAYSSNPWDSLRPERLRSNWPSTSALAYAARRSWAWIKLALLREWPDEVLGAEDPLHGPMLFYRENLRVLPLLTPDEHAPAVVQTVAKVAKGLGDLGIELVVLLVPEKEQVHVHALPPAHRQALAHGPELLASIQSQLEALGIRSINLLPGFLDATVKGQRLFWRDDTHWNDGGIRLAAEEVWRVAEPLLP
jgi:hypothetical protein